MHDDDGSDASNGLRDADDRLRYNGVAVVTTADLMATDGVVHIVDQLHVPNHGLSLRSHQLHQSNSPLL